ncbi:hypothetical protein [Pseudobacteriovorax antillogorgiicola]|uniref:Uncharacterized protein n=1 Tax=Pseudobacteriovorax antillogorgiicola TaxID=1513793 RepID=A0A1Y6CIJ1_9BACT|nr:hypothetical protein [Pseudobacteriovorax antillogorgiicola]TCS48357.1 hypothetical protein EDD56_118137 [Pseudobacteriovorax antillogorgiicola]SMF56221.1 hypothetical protein SAMN06296036_1184 [Pseudobacteriovorax antillogorgiicola]
MTKTSMFKSVLMTSLLVFGVSIFGSESSKDHSLSLEEFMIEEIDKFYQDTSPQQCPDSVVCEEENDDAFSTCSNITVYCYEYCNGRLTGIREYCY